MPLQQTGFVNRGFPGLYRLQLEASIQLKIKKVSSETRTALRIDGRNDLASANVSPIDRNRCIRRQIVIQVHVKQRAKSFFSAARPSRTAKRLLLKGASARVPKIARFA